jgi:excisionase family DNA binding protein
MKHVSNDKRDIRMVFDVPEAAAALKLSPNTVRKAIHEGQLYAIRIGRKYVIPRSELERLLSRPSGEA